MKKEDFIYQNIEAVPKVCQVLRVMNSGIPFNFEGREYLLGETVSGGFQFMVKMGDDYWLGVPEMTFNAFASMCDKITTEELFIYTSQAVLTDINRGRRKKD